MALLHPFISRVRRLGAVDAGPSNQRRTLPRKRSTPAIWSSRNSPVCSHGMVNSSASRSTSGRQVGVVVGADHVAAALRHPCAGQVQQPAQPHLGERLVERHQPHVVQGHGDEPGVQVVALHVLVAAGVEVDRLNPLVPRHVVAVDARVPQEVPRRIEERVATHRSRGAPGHRTSGTSCSRTRGRRPAATRRCRVGRKSSTCGSTHRQLRSSGTGTVPHVSQYTIGIGGPQYRCREISQSCRPADPVALQPLRPLGPVQIVQARQQPIGVRGCAQEPLRHDPLDDNRVAPLAPSA